MRKYWDELTSKFICKNKDNVYKQLIERYEEPERWYHNTMHIKQCLDELGPGFGWSHVHVALAVWFHDVVYDPHNSDNELESAKIAFTTLHNMGLKWSTAHHVADLILVTDHKSLPQTAEEKLLVDLDLSILGQAPDKFDVYESNIRREYDRFTDLTYTSGRIKVLSDFLNRVTIFNTESLWKKYEVQARANMTSSVNKLWAWRKMALGGKHYP